MGQAGHAWRSELGQPSNLPTHITNPRSQCAKRVSSHAGCQNPLPTRGAAGAFVAGAYSTQRRTT